MIFVFFFYRFTMEEDYVEYSIFSSQEESSDLVKLRRQCLDILDKFIQQYMWHQDVFDLNVKNNHLYGKITIGDNIEDEWYIIAMLFYLSEKLPVIVQVQDQDGEVLLIEAANHLPKWAQEPELAQNRVYIYQGKVHLIPIAKSPAELTPIPSGVPEPQIAAETVKRYTSVTEASAEIQKTIRTRLKSYPEDWSELLHYCHVLVPQNLKPILNKPHLVSAAIRSFYQRDILDIRTSRQMKHFKVDKLCKVGISLTKCLYAMISKQNYKPDKKSGWPVLSSDHADFKANQLGAKLTCGFEILANQKSRDEDRSEKYLQVLTNNGYFQGFLPGSQKYNELLDKAKSHLKSQSVPEEVKSPSDQLKELLKSTSSTIEDSSEELKPEDDDSWLDYKQESFDDMLRKHFNLKENGDTTKTKEEIPSEIKKFLSTVSDMSGVEDLDTDDKDYEGAIDFNADEFENALKKVLQLNGDNEHSSDSETDEMNEDLEMNDYYDAMSNELKDTKVAEDLEPLNIDGKLLSNFLESFKNQEGLQGPASTILGNLGFDINDITNNQ